jgi:hypothetical protein
MSHAHGPMALALIAVTHRYKRAHCLWLEQFQIAGSGGVIAGSSRLHPRAGHPAMGVAYRWFAIGRGGQNPTADLPLVSLFRPSRQERPGRCGGEAPWGRTPAGRLAMRPGGACDTARPQAPPGRGCGGAPCVKAHSRSGPGEPAAAIAPGAA